MEQVQVVSWLLMMSVFAGRIGSRHRRYWDRQHDERAQACIFESIQAPAPRTASPVASADFKALSTLIRMPPASAMAQAPHSLPLGDCPDNRATKGVKTAVNLQDPGPP